MAGFNSIAELKPFKFMWKIKVKIIRLWKQYSAGGGLTIEMVLVDNMGDKIHATVKQELASQFEQRLTQGASKILINFSLNHSCGSYRTTHHAYKIGFLSTTRVKVCEDLPKELSGLQPVKFGDLLDGSLNTDFLVDIIGQVVEVSPVEVVAVNGKETQKISLELRNTEDERLPIVLWGNFANDVNEAIQQRSGGESIICVLRFGKIKIWKDDRSVSNAYNVSDVSLNPNMAEVAEFVSMLPKDDLPLAIMQSKSQSIASGLSEKEDLFVNTQRKTIAELLESSQVERCIVMCTISAIECDMGWYYLSCKVCSKKVIPVLNENSDDEEDDIPFAHTYYCVKCKVTNPKLVPRYKLHLIVLDNTGNSKLMLFDNLAVQLINLPCLDLAGSKCEEQIQEVGDLPLPISNLVGKTYLFKVAIEKENYLYKHDTYKVLKIITNEDLISEFDPTHVSADSLNNRCAPEHSILSDAPEGSLMISGGSSLRSESLELTPAKRGGASLFNLEEAGDQNSVTKMMCFPKIKKEKVDKSG
ncbi:hypothetical protein Bca101_101239 [Brassica carinata]